MRAHFDLICAKVEEVNKRFAGFDNMQALYLHTSFSCTVPGIYLRMKGFKIIVQAMDGDTCLKTFSNDVNRSLASILTNEEQVI